MQILVTNDDGIDSAGIHVLAQRLTEIGDVTVFAPSGEYSGAGASIGHLAAGLPNMHRVERAEMPDVASIYHLDGPPALAALLACTGLLGAVPDLVVSGINPGWNVGHAVHFSGTIGACVTAGIFHVPGIAVSQHIGSGSFHWESAAQAAADLVPRALDERGLLNVNVPNMATSEILGTRETSLSDRVPYSLHSPSMKLISGPDARVGESEFEVAFETHGPYESLDGADTNAVEAGYISITRLTTTHAA